MDENYLRDSEPRTAAEVRQRARDVVARRAKAHALEPPRPKLSEDEARRVAAQIARLSELLRQGGRDE